MERKINDVRELGHNQSMSRETNKGERNERVLTRCDRRVVQLIRAGGRRALEVIVLGYLVQLLAEGGRILSCDACLA